MKIENLPIVSLRDHPRNYRKHPPDQLAHIERSIREHGFYRPVVLASDGTILAGHGLVAAARRMGIETIPCLRVAVASDSAQALKVLAGDNEISNLGEKDSGTLLALLDSINETQAELLGTGFDEVHLANLIATVRPDDAVVDPMAEWAGMPEFVVEDKTAYRQILVSFKDEADVAAFADLIDQSVTKETRSIWYPAQVRMDTESKRY